MTQTMKNINYTQRNSMSETVKKERINTAKKNTSIFETETITSSVLDYFDGYI